MKHHRFLSVLLALALLLTVFSPAAAVAAITADNGGHGGSAFEERMIFTVANKLIL